MSIWLTGTYDVLVSPDPKGGIGDLMIAVFAAPADPNDEEANEDAPILAQRDVARGEYDDDLQPDDYGAFPYGEQGLRPEDIAPIYGPRLALRILLTLYEAADNDFNGIDVEGHPWRPPSEEGAFPMMTRVHGLLMAMRNYLQ